MKSVAKLGLCAVPVWLGLASVSTPAWAQNGQQKQEIKEASADWNAAPEGGISAGLAQTLAIESSLPAYTGPGEIVFEMPDSAPGYGSNTRTGAVFFSWTERATLAAGPSNTVHIEGQQCFYDGPSRTGAAFRDQDALAKVHIQTVGDGAGCQTIVLNTDKTGLLIISTYGQAEPNRGLLIHDHFLDTRSSNLILDSTSVAGSNNSRIPFSGFAYDLNKDYLFGRASHSDIIIDHENQKCTISADADAASLVCVESGFHDSVLNNPEFSEYKSSSAKYQYPWSELLGLYTVGRTDVLGLYVGTAELCLRDVCNEKPHRIIDYRKGSQWHSQAVSAALSPADKQKANSLFSTGFESYKSGDFTSASALMKRGLEIDPASYLAWFTLAEIARSKHLQDANDIWAVHMALYDYQRTLDLSPPDTPEAIKSQAHLTAHSVD